MARPERSLDPAASPASRFAHALRELRRRAGRPTYREMQDRTHVSYTTLWRAAAGRRLPSWETTRAFVEACGGDLAQWRPQWEQAQAPGRNRPSSQRRSR